MHLFLAAEDSAPALRSELMQAFPSGAAEEVRPLLMGLRVGNPRTTHFPHLAFARQCLPEARPLYAETISSWANQLFALLVDGLSEDKAWQLHIEPHYGVRSVKRMGARAWHSAKMGAHDASREKSLERSTSFDPQAGRHRCRLIFKEVMSLLQKRRRHLLKRLLREPSAFTPETSLVQLLLTSPEQGYVSVACCPVPFEQRHVLSPFPKGQVSVAPDQSAPSRAFAKLVEAQLRMGRSIQSGERCVDLGAAPGSWTYVAVNQGASVLAVDRSELRADLMPNAKVRFRAIDAFRFEPEHTVDWLLCDVIAPPERSAELLLGWLRRGWCRNFIVTIKLKDEPDSQVLPMLKRELPPLTESFFINRLCANKKEVCAFGSAVRCSAEGAGNATSGTGQSGLC